METFVGTWVNWKCGQIGDDLEKLIIWSLELAHAMRDMDEIIQKMGANKLNFGTTFTILGECLFGILLNH